MAATTLPVLSSQRPSVVIFEESKPRLSESYAAANTTLPHIASNSGAASRKSSRTFSEWPSNIHSNGVSRKASRVSLPRRQLSQNGLQDSSISMASHHVPAVLGRHHVDLQTDPILEEWLDKVPETEQGTQTDTFLDRPASPLFIPRSSGNDKATQIEEGDLFDFDREVQPLLECLIGKTLEQAFVEVREEDELDALRRRQADFLARRNAELAHVLREEEAERRRTFEKEKRLAEGVRLKREREEAGRQAQSIAFAKDYVASLVPDVLDLLADHGAYYDAVEREMQSHVLPWLTDHIHQHLERTTLCRFVLDDLIEATLKLAIH